MAHKHQNTCPIPDDLCSAYREQLRIINLLTAASDGGEVSISLSSLIALIQGEN